MKLVCILFLFFSSGLFAFDHSHKTFDNLLKKYVTAGQVDYKAMKANSINDLNSYISSLSSVTREEYSGFTTEQKLAFLINSYNAFTIKLILDNYPVKSIRKIGGIFTSPWKVEFFELLGEKRHLDWIEHSQLRKEFSEPRIHFTIVCASISCPILASEAYIPEKLEQQLESAKVTFLNDTTKNSYNQTENELNVSSIFKWFEEDFIKRGSLTEFIRSGMKAKIKPGAKIKYNDYDWRLNEKK